MNKKIKKVLTILLLITISTCYINTSNTHVSAKIKVSYITKELTETYNVENGTITAKYRYDLPQLSGNSSAIEKINKSLEKGYTKSLTDKERLLEYAKSGYVLDNNDTYFSTTTCNITYNQNNYISFCFKHKWYAGGTSNIWTDGISFDLKTGNKLKITDVISGDKNTVKNKIINKYLKVTGFGDNTDVIYELDRTKISQFQFYLKNRKVILCFGPYAPGYGNGHFEFSLSGNY